MFAQLWHLGRVCHPLHQCGLPAVGPSSIPAKGGNFRLLASPNKDKPLGYVQHPEAIKDPKHYVQLFAKSAEYAKQAEFDGVELHCANGYLPNQFLDSNANKRTDEYGGSIENRCRFVLESVEALIKSFGSSKRVGIKLSPQGGYNDVGETEEEEKRLFEYLVVELDKMDIAYIQLSNSVFGSRNKLDITSLTPLIKNAKVFYNGNYTLESGLKHLNNGDKSADCIVYGVSIDYYYKV